MIIISLRILHMVNKSRKREVKRTMLDIFEQKEVEAIDRRNFRKEIIAEVTEEVTAKVIKKVTEEVASEVTAKVTAELTAKNKENAIMLIRGRKISLDEVSLFFPQFSKEDIEAIKEKVEL